MSFSSSSLSRGGGDRWGRDGNILGASLRFREVFCQFSSPTNRNRLRFGFGFFVGFFPSSFVPFRIRAARKNRPVPPWQREHFCLSNPALGKSEILIKYSFGERKHSAWRWGVLSLRWLLRISPSTKNPPNENPRKRKLFGDNPLFFFPSRSRSCLWPGEILAVLDAGIGAGNISHTPRKGLRCF